ncbi:MAG: hypothetical protein P1U63_11360 [Coxiellaceae bacterium]|nr:hypothetical protein [Coxiellaceae bacterium]
MRYCPPVLTASEGCGFTVSKISRKSIPSMPGAPIRLSAYQLTEKSTGKTALYTAQHEEVDESLPSISQIRSSQLSDVNKKRKIRDVLYPAGGYSNVKKLQRVLKGDEGVDDPFPSVIALKCYKARSDDSKKAETIAAAKRCSSLYREMGQFSLMFSSERQDASGHLAEGSDKYFLMMPYYGKGYDLLKLLADQTLLPKPVSAEQLIPLFYRLLHDVSVLHERFGMPIVDLKPENMILEFDETGEPIAIRLIDLDGVFYEGVSYTLAYLTEKDRSKYAGDGMLREDIPFEVDFRSLSIVLNLLCSDLISDYCVDRVSTKRRSGKLTHQHHDFTPRAFMQLSESQFELLAMISQLQRGKNPADETMPLCLRRDVLSDLTVIVQQGKREYVRHEAIIKKLISPSVSDDLKARLEKQKQYSHKFVDCYLQVCRLYADINTTEDCSQLNSHQLSDYVGLRSRLINELRSFTSGFASKLRVTTAQLAPSLEHDSAPTGAAAVATAAGVGAGAEDDDAPSPRFRFK